MKTAFVIVVATLLVARFVAPRVPPLRTAGMRMMGWLDSRWAPLAVALATIVALSYAWGSWNAIPVVHDEASYLLQAKIFAMLHWTVPPPPVPEFFEQFHVFVVPAYASKYPPGHALLLVPGIWLGAPGLMPVVISGLTAALVFAIARRVANGAVALLTWLVWLSAPLVMALSTSYFSQTTSALAWMLGWYALLRWRAGEDRWLLVVSVSVAWLGITRPLTAVAYTIPIGLYVLWRVSRTRRWASLLRPMALGAALLLVIPLWSAKTIGTTQTTPYSFYSELYFPWDAPGFGLDSTSPSRALPPDMAWIHENTAPLHVGYVPAALPGAFAERAAQVGRDMWAGRRLVLAALAVIGLAAIGAELLVALATGVLLLVVYLSFLHSPLWSLYYIELQPVLAFVTALGAWSLVRARSLAELRRPPRDVDLDGRAMSGAAFLPVAAVALLCLVPAVRERRTQGASAREYQERFANAVRSIPFRKSIVFVRYAPDHNPHLSLIRNDPPFDDARTWIVYDRGRDNLRLMAKAPDRTPLLYDEARHQIHLFDPARDTATLRGGP